MFQDLKFCMKDSACKVIQYCDKTLYKLYGTCELYGWFWALIVLVVLVILISVILFTLRKQLKTLCNRGAPEDSNDSAETQQLNQENPNKVETRLGNRRDPKLHPAIGPSVRERVQEIEERV